MNLDVLRFIKDKIFKSPVQALLVFALIFIEALFYSSFAYSIQYIIQGLSEQNYNLLIFVFSLLIFGFILNIFLIPLRCYLASKMVGSITGSIRQDIFEKISKLPVMELNRTDHTQLLTYYNEVDFSVKNALALIPSGIILPISSLIINIILMITISVKLTVISVLTIPLIMIVPVIVMKLIKKLYRENNREAELKSFSLENIMLQLAVRVFDGKEHEQQIFDKKNQTQVGRTAKIAYYETLVSSYADLMPMMLRILAFVFGSYFVYRGGIGVAELISFEFVFVTLIYSVNRLFYSLPVALLGYSGLSKIREFVEKELEAETREAPHLNGEKAAYPIIKFNNVSFEYQDSKGTVSDLDFEIPHSYVALVGPSGSGKSTIMNLLLNFYTPQKGNIQINGKDISTISKKDLYKIISYVPQEALLFNRSIKENILIGKRDATDEEVEMAAKKAHLHENIMLMPRQYDTLVGEGGNRLSGGQKQRLAIARAMIRSPQILLLDEITSALDPAAEQAVNDTVAEIAKSCTVIYATHHLKSIEAADCIFVLYRGKICEFGNKNELIKKDGVYKELWDKQFKDQEEILPVSINRLQKIPLFKEIKSEYLRDIQQMFSLRFYQAGTTIFEQGDIGDAFYIIMHGSIEISKTDSLGGTEVFRLGEGDFFGELALIKLMNRSAKARSLTQSTLLTLSRDQFLVFLNMHQRIKEKIEEKVNEYTVIKDEYI